MAISGLGSGLDIQSIVKAMVDAERAPKTLQLDRLEKTTTAKFSALGQFRSALSDFQTALKDLNDPKLFQKRSATSSDDKIFTATASGSAASGSFSMQVFNLAQSSKVALAGVDTPTQTLGTGTVSISVGDRTLDVELTEGADSLAALRDAINRSGKDMGLSAAIVNDPAGGGGARLVLTSSTSGTGNDISVSTTTLTGDLGVLDFTPAAPDANFTPTPVDPDNPRAARVISYSRDANFAIDGISLSSASNTIDEVVEGVSITLKSAQSPTDIANANALTLGVNQDKDGVRAGVQKFVDAYNKMMGTLNSLTKVTAVGGDSGKPVTGALVGDASVRNAQSALRSVLGEPAGNGELRILADLGITTQNDGTLKLDTDRLGSVLDNNFDQMSGFLTGDRGLLTRLNDKLEPYTQTGGIVESRTKALQTTLKGVDEQREALSRRVTQLESRLFAQFNAMDQLVGQLSQTSQYLEGQLANLPGVVRQDRRR